MNNMYNKENNNEEMSNQMVGSTFAEQNKRKYTFKKEPKYIKARKRWWFTWFPYACLLYHFHQYWEDLHHFLTTQTMFYEFANPFFNIVLGHIFKNMPFINEILTIFKI